jgi:hypothetical protein
MGQRDNEIKSNNNGATTFRITTPNRGKGKLTSLVSADFCQSKLGEGEANKLGEGER